ncbi:hypothetical protein PRUPE_8G152900 [Prunus persica]|uniref:Uncharacterized protein n=1 Tax=Prunus persica TaxID=3760 RepID=M5W0E5_PRUPE|nr:hypothetical protein PRUPE_8G152900 [Prunus persica]
MGLCKMSFALICLVGFALLQPTLAQDSPQDYLNAHNAARAAVGVRALTWDPNLAAYAQRYANSRKAKSSGDMSGTAAVNLFVSEKANYNYNSNTCAPNKVCGHYTQVVWRNSARVGCAKVRCNNGGTFIGCNYDPPGNYVGQKPY